MTSTQTIKLTVLLMTIICLIFGYIYNGASASYECFNKEVAQMQLKQAKWLKAKVTARKSYNQWTLLCNKTI